MENCGKTFTDKTRINAVKKAISEGYQVAIFDDGLQDQSILYNLTFVCFNQKNKIGNGRLIPSGPLRENLNILTKNKNIFLIGNDYNNEIFKDRLLRESSNLNFYEGIYEPRNLGLLNKEDNYVVFSGIGNHETFVDMLKKHKFKILKDLEYPDHYSYSIDDIEKINHIAIENNAKILTTKKDYLRIKDEHKKNIYIIDIHLKIKQIDQLKDKLIFKNENY